MACSIPVVSLSCPVGWLHHIKPYSVYQNEIMKQPFFFLGSCSCHVSKVFAFFYSQKFCSYFSSNTWTPVSSYEFFVFFFTSVPICHDACGQINIYYLVSYLYLYCLSFLCCAGCISLRCVRILSCCTLFKLNSYVSAEKKKMPEILLTGHHDPANSLRGSDNYFQKLDLISFAT